MDQNIRRQLDNIRSADRELQNKAFTGLLQVTDKPVEWDCRNVYDAGKDEKIRAKALALIETEDDLKYRRKYATLWKK